MVADAALIPWTGVGSEGFFPGMGGIALRQERRLQHTEGCLVRQLRSDEAQVDQLPFPVEPDASPEGILPAQRESRLETPE